MVLDPFVPHLEQATEIAFGLCDDRASLRVEMIRKNHQSESEGPLNIFL